MGIQTDNIAELTVAGWGTGWRPIEAAPKDGTRIMLADKDDVETGQWVEELHFPNTRTVFPAGWEDDRYDAAHVFEPGHLGKQPTHWMPLPAPPSDEQRNG